MPVMYEKRDHIGVVTLSRPGSRERVGPRLQRRPRHALRRDGRRRRHPLRDPHRRRERRRVLRRREPEGPEDAHAGFGGRVHQEHREAQAARVRGRSATSRSRSSAPSTATPSASAASSRSAATCSSRPTRRSGGCRRSRSASCPPTAAARGSHAGSGAATRCGSRIGFPLKAEEAHRIGLAQWVVPHAKLMDKALEVAAHLASLPPLAARLDEGVAAAGPRHPERSGRVARRPLPLRHARADRGQGRRAPAPGARSASRRSRDADVDLALTEPQELLRSSARTFLEREAPPHRDRRAAARGLEPGARSLAQGVDAGWLGILIPSEYGGSDSSVTDAAVLYEELGRGPLPGPFFSSGVLGALTVLEAGDRRSSGARILPGVASGDDRARGRARRAEHVVGRAGRHAARAAPVGDRYRLDGTKLFVSDATRPRTSSSRSAPATGRATSACCSSTRARRVSARAACPDSFVAVRGDVRRRRRAAPRRRASTRAGPRSSARS